MASRGFSKSLRAARQLAAPRVQLQQRSFVAARQLVRAATAARPVAGAAVQQVRGVKTMDFAGHKEDVY
ncbi:Acetolactate synthase, mitochondrial, partial [Claviceps pusilla]